MAEPKQQKVKRRRGFVDVVNALLTLIVLGVLVAGGVGVYGAHNFYSAGPITQDTEFTVAKGDNLGKVDQVDVRVHSDQALEDGLHDREKLFWKGHAYARG